LSEKACAPDIYLWAAGAVFTNDSARSFDSAMDDAACADCEMLQEAALNATIRHFHAESRLTIAKLIHDSQAIRALEPLVDSLFQTRSAAVQAYQEHVDTHAQKAAQSGV
jgi:hypothetical protein